MRRIVIYSALLVSFSALALAATWSGTLIDTGCYSQRKSVRACPATTATQAFALNVTGKMYALDDAGNTQAKAAIESRAYRATGQNAKGSRVRATITGARQGGTLQVDDIQIQQ